MQKVSLCNQGVKTIGVARSIAITLCIATLYFVSVHMTPALSITMGSIGIRIGNSFRALALLNPLAALGVALGGHYVNVSMGRAWIGLYPVLPILHALGGYAVYKLRGGLLRNFILLAMYGTLMAVAVSINHALLKAPAFASPEFTQLFLSAVGVRIIGEVIATAVAGTFLYRALDRGDLT